MLILISETLLALIAVAVVYHHAGYPLLLRYLANRQRAHRNAQGGVASPSAGSPLPSVTLIIPARNEATVIVAKLANLAQLDYPRDRLSVVLALDGCTDDTPAVVQAALPRLQERLPIQVVEYAMNRGKIAVLNAQIAAADSDIVALSDASATIDSDALLKAAAHFSNATVGVVCGGYRLKDAGSEGERAYWDYQTAIKADEAAIAAPMGAHGAFYLFRRSLWTPLPADTINDDFILPMTIVARGYRAVYDPTIAALELERSESEQEFRRRVRIGAGNMQQVLRLPTLLDPRRGALAFVFASGKGLRPFMPFMLAAAVVLVSILAVVTQGPLFKVVFTVGAALASVVAVALHDREREMPRAIRWLAYFVEGHAAAGIGAAQYLLGSRVIGWQPAGLDAKAAEWTYLKPEVTAGKRAFDIIFGSMALAALAVVFIPIALAIKIESPGPIFYRQRRVGRWTPDMVETFELFKFRSMFADAESKSGAVWATKNDPRITRVGLFLRKTRLDELPQCINVLSGAMSIIGPRPERSKFFTKLEDAVPFYTERTFGIRPGITGLAQVNLPYDETIDDVRLKCVYDHAYATRLTSFGEWLKTDISIVAKTIKVMVLGKGQ